MKPVLYGDLSAAARAVFATSAPERFDKAHAVVRQAQEASEHRKRTGRAHPLWGNGTVMSAAMAGPLAPEPRLDNPEYLNCLILVLQAVRAAR